MRRRDVRATVVVGTKTRRRRIFRHRERKVVQRGNGRVLLESKRARRKPFVVDCTVRGMLLDGYPSTHLGRWEERERHCNTAANHAKHSLVVPYFYPRVIGDIKKTAARREDTPPTAWTYYNTTPLVTPLRAVVCGRYGEVGRLLLFEHSGAWKTPHRVKALNID